jgi:SH3 domain protein
MQNRFIRGLLTGLLLLLATTAAAETVYVIDELRLSVRANPNSSDPAIARVETGDPLTVLESEKRYVKVRTAEGVEGWVSKAYVSGEQPARLKLERLQKDYARVEGELGEAREALNAGTELNKAMEKRLDEVNHENASLQKQLERYTSSTSQFTRKYGWLFELIGLGVLILFGFALGVRWQKSREFKRLGGFEL